MPCIRTSSPSSSFLPFRSITFISFSSNFVYEIFSLLSKKKRNKQREYINKCLLSIIITANWYFQNEYLSDGIVQVIKEEKLNDEMSKINPKAAKVVDWTSSNWWLMEETFFLSPINAWKFMFAHFLTFEKRYKRGKASHHLPPFSWIIDLFLCYFCKWKHSDDKFW